VRGLVVQLDSPLPASLPIGSATAVFCCGSCFHRQDTIEDLEIVVDGVHRYRPAAVGMPRLDVASRDAAGYRSGFWATVPIRSGDHPGSIELAIAARLASGREVVATLGAIDVVDSEPLPSQKIATARPGAELIAICMATFEPNTALFRTQIDSLRSQADDRWICVISDDCSSAEHFEHIAAAVEGDSRFVLSRSPRRLGFYDNFQRALRMAPADVGLLALCDQDDRWHPEKLRVLRDALGDAQLVYSDQRLVDADGRVLRDTMWRGRRNNHTNLASTLVANSITGASALFRRDVAELALPFPEPPGFRFHDHWLALVAMASGKVAYVDRPLYDYVQHAGAVFGDVTQGSGPKSPGRRRPWRGLAVRWRAAYFYGYQGRAVQAQTLLLRCADRLTARKRRALERFLTADRSPASFAWLALRPLRSLWGRNETLASETELAQGIIWRWLVGLGAGRAHSRGPGARDASLPSPASFSQKRLRRWRARL
jgi:hypothetical protein